MADDTGVELPPRSKAAGNGSRWLGVVPIAQAAVVGDDVLVQLIALERRDNGAILTARISRLEETILTEPRDNIPWPRLVLEAHDDQGTTYRIDGGAGSGSQSDWHVEYGIAGTMPNNAPRLKLTITEFKWEDLSTGAVDDRKTGEWTFTVDLARQLPARMV